MTAYVTQIGPDGSGHDRCAAACVASSLLSAGWQSDPFGLCLEVAGKLWPNGEPYGATSEDVQRVLSLPEYGFGSEKWVEWGTALAALDAGRDVYCLLNNWHVRPRPYPPGLTWNALHWLRLVGVLDGGDMAYVYDPLCYLPAKVGSAYQGPTVCTVDSLRAGIAETSELEAGLLVWKL